MNDEEKAKKQCEEKATEWIGGKEGYEVSDPIKADKIKFSPPDTVAVIFGAKGRCCLGEADTELSEGAIVETKRVPCFVYNGAWVVWITKENDVEE